MFIQAERLIAVDTPLGANVLLLRSMSGAEGVSRLFQFQLDFLSEDPAVDFDSIVGQNITVRIELADGTTERFLNGHVSRFLQLPDEGHMAHYQAEMVPWLWFLSRTSDCRIFQDMSVPQVIAAVFQDFGFTDFDNQLQKTYHSWKYCVQYRETALNFVMRLMEQEGIAFFFRHESGKHVLIMADSISTYKPCPHQAMARYEHVTGRGYERAQDVVFRWRCQQEMRPGRYAITDYNFETPNSSLLSSIDSKINQGGNQRFEIFDYPGEYETRGQGDTLVNLRIEEQEAPHIVGFGDSNCRDFASGYRFELSEHDRDDQNGEYLLTSVTHSAHSGSFYSAGKGQGASYTNTFTCIPLAVPFRPPRVTPRPVVQGPQTAVVAGREGEEIYVDKYGRVKVHFHWDRHGSYHEQSSCWVRVSQPWAGKNWGGIWIPRIGQEVVVEFLEGDPDRPLITGAVYNADQMPPYELPANQTQSGIKSRSSKSGGAANFNEIRFEDKKGSEEIHVNAERNLTTVVEADESRSIAGSRSTKIKKDETLVISDGNRKETLEKGNDSLQAQAGNIQVQAPVGKHSVSAKDAETTGTLSVTLTCGGSTIKMTPASIDITSPLITIKGGMVKINC